MKINSLINKCFLTLLLVFLLGTGTVWAGLLNVPQRYQVMNQWCWAACSQAVMEYYGKSYTQYDIADYGTCMVNTWNWIWGSSSWDDPNPGDPPRNGINLILRYFANLPSTRYTNSLLESAVKTQIDAGRPFVVRWEWDTGGGHFVVARGLVDDNMYLMDPWNGPTINTYSWVCVGSGHTWTDTLTTNTSPPITAILLNLLLNQ
jgi:hypothetical protein